MTETAHHSSHAFPVVVIGASAGGLIAFERFLSALPEDFDFALIFMQHLSSKHKNLLPELLRNRVKRFRIEELVEGIKIVPGVLFLCPPALEVRIEENIGRVATRSKPHQHLPIDEFLSSLAHSIPERTIAAIFSGGGTDGARGIRTLRKAGGTVFVQDPATAQYPDMPLAAINTAQMDGVFSPEEMVGEILKFHRSGMVHLPAENLMTTGHFETLFRLVYERTGCRFTHYKRNVVVRRIRRRMYLHAITSIDAYLEYLERTSPEADQVASDLMIGVTSFFRDRLAWKALHLEVTRKFVAQEESTPIRVWTPACATGEEAYSVAMLLRHELDLVGKGREVQVFATDLNERALERARDGVYPVTVTADVQPEYISKFFTSSSDKLSLIVNKDIRQMVVFAKQDLLSDPPFSRLDLVICRNLLIYLEPEAQEKCLVLFHYALKKDGFLFLGNAESPGRNSSLFVSLAHKKCRIYRKTDERRSPRLSLSVPYASERAIAPLRHKPSEDHRQSITQAIQDTLIEEHAPIAVAINQNYDILYHNGPTSRYLRQPRGEPTRNLMELVPERVRNRLRGGIYRASHEGKPVTIRMSIPDDRERPKIVTLRISRVRETVFLITFRDKGAPLHEMEALPLDCRTVEETAVHQLENELSSTRDSLQSYIEQLRSLNEELNSSNEELQAANEELETSREELQSLNEELTTVNQQLQTKIEEQEETNNDLTNFLTSTSIPTIFLDQQMRLKRFTPAMARLTTLIPGDTGRLIHDMSQENLGPDLLSDARSVLDSLTPVKRELAIKGARYVRTTLPYRTAGNRIEGVVVTYTDITELRKVEARTRHLASFPGLNPNPIIELDIAGEAVYLNPAAESLLKDSGMGGDYRPLLPLDMASILRDWDRSTALTLAREVYFDGRAFDETVQLVPDLGVARIYARDISQRKSAEEALRASEERVRLKLKSILEPDEDLGDLELSDVIDYEAIDALMEDYHSLAGIAMAIIDMKGNVIVGKGWQEICTRFHRVNPESYAHCLESDLRLSEGVALGEAKLYKCENHMWDMATPIVIGGQHVGNAFLGQFFFEDEVPDYEVFRSQAKHYGFPEEEYIRALEAVPRLSRVTVDGAMSFLMKLAQILSQLSYSNIKLAKLLVRNDSLLSSLQESEERFRSMFERHKAIMLLIEPHTGLIVDANLAASEFYGYSRDELKALHIQEINQLSPVEVAGERQKTFKGERDHFIFPHRIADGTIRWVDAYSTPIEAQGKSLLFSVIHDITERRQAQEEREKAVAFLRLINESADKRDLMSSAIRFFQDYSGCEAVAIRLRRGDDYPYYEAHGFPASFLAKEDSLVGLAHQGEPLCGDDDRPVMECMCGRVIEGRFDQSQPFFSPAGSFWTNSTTEVRNLTGSGSDSATIRHHCNTEGYESVALIAIKIADETKGLLQVNDSQRGKFTPEQIGFWERLAGYLAVALAKFEAEDALKEAHEDLEKRVQERTFELSHAYEALHEESEERKRVEEQLRQAHKMEAIGTLAGGIAHDFNNILAAIIGFTEIASDDSGDRPDVERALSHVLKAAHRGRDLVRQILAFSRKSDTSRSLISLGPIIQETIHLLRASIPSTIEIAYRTSTTADSVVASPGEIQQILMNLSTNAALAMQAKGGSLEISLNDIELLPDSAPLDADVLTGEYLQLSVKDTGTGMTPDIMKRIFEPFYTTREVGKGTGMGLAVVYGIVKDLRGAVSVESEPGVGSIFRVFLPKVRPEIEPEPVSPIPSPEGSERILLVDDEELIIEWGEAVLARLGYEVTSSTDSMQALKIFSGDPSAFDLVITDQTMPLMTGMELAEKLFALRKDIPIILCTGHSETVTQEDVLAIGIKDYLLKPVKKSELAEAIRRALSSEKTGVAN
ncbi:MAG TPA: PocR ligand-binding domain-containing protein [Syntrophorhabdaceae bacterium]|jgi:two-component system CheB/CheR fusion protein